MCSKPPPRTHAPTNDADNYLSYTKYDSWWTMNPHGEQLLQGAPNGVASYKETPLMSFCTLFKRASDLNGTRPALRVENAQLTRLANGEAPPSKSLKKWDTWTWGQYYNDSRNFAKACIACELDQHQTVVIFGFNSPYWAMSAMGAILAGGKSAGLYPTDNAQQVQYKANHSDARVAVVETEHGLNIFKGVAEDLPLLNVVVCYGCDAAEDIVLKSGRVVRTYTFAQFIAMGEKESDTEFETRLGTIKPAHCCSLVYTSGTTGPPKAAMLSHDNIHYASRAGFSIHGKTGKAKVENRVLSYLPLSHVAGLAADVFAQIVITANVNYKGWGCTYFARPYDLKLGTLVGRLKAVKPTGFLAVPRVWEKMMEKLDAQFNATTGLRKTMLDVSRKKATLKAKSMKLGSTAKPPKLMFFSNYVLGKIHKKLGLDKAYFLMSGAAPLSIECTEFFDSIGMHIVEGYGLTETTALLAWASASANDIGSCGYECPGMEVRIINRETQSVAELSQNLYSPTEAQQGEILVRGRAIMMGYMANERLGQQHVNDIAAANREAIDGDGFHHTGDKGTMDQRGLIKVTGRYKELIVSAGGENIAPVPIEDFFKKTCPFISNAVIIGDKRKFNVLLLTLKSEGATGEMPGTGKLTQQVKDLFPQCDTVKQAISSPDVIKAITSALELLNNTQEVIPSNAARIQKFTILPRDFSIVTGEMTATLKLKRFTVEALFEPIIDKMYEEADVYVNYFLAPTPLLPMGNGNHEMDI